MGDQLSLRFLFKPVPGSIRSLLRSPLQLQKLQQPYCRVTSVRQGPVCGAQDVKETGPRAGHCYPYASP